MVDAIEGTTADAHVGDGSPFLFFNSEDIYAALTPEGTWKLKDRDAIFHGSIRKRAQQHHFQQYIKSRYMKRIYANEPTRWLRYCTSLFVTLTKATHKSPRQIGRRSKHLFD